MLALIAISVDFNATNDKAASAFKVFFALYFVIVVILHTPVVALQVQSQCRKLASNDTITGQADDFTSKELQSTVYDKATVQQDDENL